MGKVRANFEIDNLVNVPGAIINSKKEVVTEYSSLEDADLYYASYPILNNYGDLMFMAREQSTDFSRCFFWV